MGTHVIGTGETYTLYSSCLATEDRSTGDLILEGKDELLSDGITVTTTVVGTYRVIVRFQTGEGHDLTFHGGGAGMYKSSDVIKPQVNYVTIDGLRIYGSGTGARCIETATNVTELAVINCVMKTISNHATSAVYIAAFATGEVNVSNNAIYCSGTQNANGVGIYAQLTGLGDSFYVCYNTIHNYARGVRGNGGTTDGYLRGNKVTSSNDACFYGTAGWDTADFNASTDGTAPGTNKRFIEQWQDAIRNGTWGEEDLRTVESRVWADGLLEGSMCEADWDTMDSAYSMTADASIGPNATMGIAWEATATDGLTAQKAGTAALLPSVGSKSLFFRLRSDFEIQTSGQVYFWVIGENNGMTGNEGIRLEFYNDSGTIKVAIRLLIPGTTHSGWNAVDVGTTYRMDMNWDEDSATKAVNAYVYPLGGGAAIATAETTTTDPLQMNYWGLRTDHATGDTLDGHVDFSQFQITPVAHDEPDDTARTEWDDDAVFGSNFEGPATLADRGWGTVGSGSDHAEVHEDAALRGSQGLRAALDTALLQGRDIDFDEMDDATVVFALEVASGASMGSGDSFYFHPIYNSSYGPLMDFDEDGSGGFKARFYSHPAGYTSYTGTLTPGTTYWFKMRRIKHASAGVSRIDYKADGAGSWTNLCNHTAQNTDAWGFDRISAFLQLVDATTSGDIHIDRVEVSTTDIDEPAAAYSPYGLPAPPWLKGGPSTGLGTYWPGAVDGQGDARSDWHIGCDEPSSGGVTISLDTLSAEASLPTMTLSPGAVTASLSTLEAEAELPDPTLAPGSVALSLDTLAAEAALLDPALSPGSVSAQLDTLEAVSELLDVVLSSGAGTLILDTLEGQGELLDPALSPGAVSIATDTLEAIAELIDVALASGAGTLSLDTLAAEAALVNPTLSPGSVSILLDTLEAVAQLESLTYPAVASGHFAVALTALRTLLAATTEFQTWVGAGSAEAAKASIHLSIAESPANPNVVLSLGSTRGRRDSGGARGYFLHDGELLARFKDDIAEGDVGDFEAAENAFLGQLDTVLRAALDLSGSDSHISLRRFTLRDDPVINHQDEDADTYEALCAAEWGEG
jgi:hypothetical protein